MPASIEMINYYFHQISSFCCFNVLMYYAVLITGSTYRSLVTRSPRLWCKNIDGILCAVKALTIHKLVYLLWWWTHRSDPQREI